MNEVLKRYFGKLRDFFGGGQAKAVFDYTTDLAIAAIPYIDVVASIAAPFTPTRADDAALMFIHARYPQLFDGSLKTSQEVKLYMFSAACDLLKQRYPTISTSMARAAVSAAYLGKVTEEKK